MGFPQCKQLPMSAPPVPDQKRVFLATIVLQGTSATGVGSFGGNNLRLGVGYHGNTATKWNLFTINNRALSAYEIKQNFDYYRTRYNI
jgi:hypothetical protein